MGHPTRIHLNNIRSAHKAHEVEPHFKPRPFVLALLACTALAGAPVAHTQSVLPHGGAMNVTQTSQNAIINWDSFSVGAGQSVNFNPPNA